MTRARSLQSEILISMVLLLVAATTILSFILVSYLLRQQQAQVVQFLDLLGPVLYEEAVHPGSKVSSISLNVEWWDVPASGEGKARLGTVGELDADAQVLVGEARTRRTMLFRSGYSWEPIWFAASTSDQGHVVVARLPSATLPMYFRVAPYALVLFVLLGDVMIFAFFGLDLIRRRVVRPLQDLRDASVAVSQGKLDARVPLSPSEELNQVCRAFNSMADSLEERTGDLQEAVQDLSETNATLHRTKIGMAQAERLAVIGRLAAGVAHEVGNPIGSILAFIDLAKRDKTLSETSAGHLERALGQGQRVRTILRQLLDYSRPSISERKPFSLEGVVAQSISLVKAQGQYSEISISVEGGGHLPDVLGDAGETQQVVLNLLLNAADAVKTNSDPRVEVVLEDLEWKEEEEGQAGLFVACSIYDNGPGVAEEDRERIFDPFFTTKPVGEGTGLGLANALNLAELQGGKLVYVPAGKPGKGCFRLALPTGSDSKRN